MSTQEAVRHVEGEVRELIRRSGLDPARDSKAVRRLVQDAVQDYDERSLHGGMPTLGDQRHAVHSILAVVAGYGPLAAVLRRRRRRGDLDQRALARLRGPWRHRRADPRRSSRPTTCATSSSGCSRAAAGASTSAAPSSTRRSPTAPGSMSSSPTSAGRHWQVNIRKFVVKADHLDDLVRLGTMPRQAATFLEAAVASGLNVLVAGGTQAGKTTLLNCLAAAIPPRERIVTCEEVFELKIAAARRGRHAVPPAQPRGHGRDPAAPPRQGGAADASVAHHRRRGAAGGEPRPAHRPEQRRAGHVHRARQQRPRGRHEDVHAAAARRRERLEPLRRADRGGGGRRRRPRRPRRDGVRRVREIVAVPGRVEGDVIEIADLFVTREGALRRADGFPPHREAFERAGYDVAALLGQADS